VAPPIQALAFRRLPRRLNNPCGGRPIPQLGPPIFHGHQSFGNIFLLETTTSLIEVPALE
jgi:hypothetical protein